MKNRVRVALALACLGPAGSLAAQTITEFPIATGSLGAQIAAGSDGNLWFTDPALNKIGRITPSGVISEFSIPTAGSIPVGIAAGPDGNLWFTEAGGNNICRITTAGAITEFPIPTVGSNPTGIVAGRDGNLWFTELLANKIGRITTAGVVTAEFPLPLPLPLPVTGSAPNSIAAGWDGNLWFTEWYANRIGRITTTGVVTEFSIPTSTATLPAYTVDYGAAGIAAGPDGNMWFTEYFGNQIGRITTAGAITEFVVPTPADYPYSGPSSIAAGADGNMWFTEYYANQIGRITTAGAVTELPVPTQSSGVSGITAGPDGNVWFAEWFAIGRITVGPCNSWATEPLDLGEGALDISSGTAGQTRFLFWDADRLSVRTLDASCLWTNTPFEGPFSGWNATAIADGSDGLSRVLWQNSDGRVGLEYVGSEGYVTAVRFAAEAGWIAIDVSVGANGRTHMLRTSSDGKIRITTVDSFGSSTESPTYGPYSGWSARAIADGLDGVTLVLWRHTDGTAGIARYREGAFEASFRWAANPGSVAEDIAAGQDGFPRVLWTNADGSMEIASVDAQGHLFDRQIHSSSGQQARRISASSDGLTRVLWTAADRTGSLWILNPDNSVKPQTPPAISLAGTWTGTYQGDPLEGCEPGPAEATFQQQGSTVTGFISTAADSCGSRQRTFQGVIQGNTLTGTITEGGFGFGAHGVLSGDNLNITFNNAFGYIFGHLTLHR